MPIKYTANTNPAHTHYQTAPFPACCPNLKDRTLGPPPAAAEPQQGGSTALCWRRGRTRTLKYHTASINLNKVSHRLLEIAPCFTQQPINKNMTQSQ